MSSPATRRRDPTFLRLAVLAAIGGGAAIGTSIYATWSTMRGGHPTSTYFFFSLWGIAALAGAAANIATYFQSGDPPEKPPRGGKKIAAPIALDTRRRERADHGSERKAA